MSIKVIIRIDDIKDQFDFNELKSFFIENFPQIPICFYVCKTHLRHFWKDSLWLNIKDTIKQYKWEIGGHTLNHTPLDGLSKDQIILEIEENIRHIEEGLKRCDLDYKVTSFAYPWRIYNNFVKEKLCRTEAYF